MHASSRQSFLCAMVLLAMAGATARGQESHSMNYRMEGVVTEEGTNRPVPGAVVQVLIESERQTDNRVRSAATDAKGRYSLLLPLGHAWEWNLVLPAGYLPVQANPLEQFATTPEQPAFQKDYQVRRGTPWPVVVHLPAAAPRSRTVLILSQQREGAPFSTFGEVADDGRCVVTMPSDGAGEFIIHCGDEGRVLTAPGDMKLQVTKGFRTDHVSELRSLSDGAIELRDEDGRTAKLHGLQATLKDRAVTLIVEMKAAAGPEKKQIVGRVTNSQGEPIAGAEVMVAMHAGQGSAATSWSAVSQAYGAFQLAIAPTPAEARISLVVTKDGFGGIDTEPRAVDFAKSSSVDVGEIKLSPGGFVRVRVVDPDGKPLAGAIVEPTGSYAARTQIARTDAEGFCTLKNLSTEIVPVFARFGKLSTSTKLPLVDGDSEPVVLKLSPPRDVPATASAALPKALKAGTPAPELQIAAWSDGKARKLADYRGKVVVLDFWGVWCGPCINSIPAMKQLHDKYKDEDIVFLSIHTAGTDMSVIQKLLKQQEWQTIAGLDAGDDIESSATVDAFAVRQFPTVMVLDRQGKIAFNSADLPGDPEQARKQFMKQAEEDAKSLGLPWPIDKDATQEQIVERISRLQVLSFSREIDQALKSNAE